ncbi:MAG: hypothetical protein LBI37_01445 [Puniceicoccales bacterium]|nr:hypothetical protein [Puniceicoccales bacterium]
MDYKICNLHKITLPVIAAEFVADFSIINNNPKVCRYEKFSQLPKALRDLSLLVDKSEPVAAVIDKLNTIAKAACDDTFFIEKINLFDIYTGEEIASGSKSISFELSFRPIEKTLEAEVINEAFEKVQMIIEKNTPYSVRRESK